MPEQTLSTRKGTEESREQGRSPCVLLCAFSKLLGLQIVNYFENRKIKFFKKKERLGAYNTIRYAG